LDERVRLVAEHRDAMVGDPAEFSMSSSVTHTFLILVTCPYSALAGWSMRIPRLRPMLCRISLISFSDLRPKFFVFNISPSVFCTSSRMVRMFAFFRQLYDRTDSSSCSTLLSRFSFSEPVGLVSAFVSVP